MFLPEWGTKKDINYYRLVPDEELSYASQSDIVHLTVEQGETQNIVYQINTVYMTLGLIGGIAIAVYIARWLCMHSYDEFKFEQAMLAELYSQ
jgi:hypothetical protein